MPSKKQQRLFAFAFGGLFLGLWTPSQSMSGQRQPLPPLIAEAKSELAQIWSSSRPGPGYAIKISCLIGDDGKIYEPEMLSYSKDAQYDAECLEAICSLSPLKNGSTNETCHIQHFTEEFGATDGLQPKYDGGDVKEYLRLHEKQKGHTAFVLVHKIPVSVLDRFPGMFQKDEIITPTNLIEIDSEFGGHATNDQGERLVPPHYVSSIGNLYAHWEQLFRNPKITKTEIIRYSESAIRSAR